MGVFGPVLVKLRMDGSSKRLVPERLDFRLGSMRGRSAWAFGYSDASLELLLQVWSRAVLFFQVQELFLGGRVQL